MIVHLHNGNDRIELTLPDDTIVYQSNYKKDVKSADQLLSDSLSIPVGCDPLTALLPFRKAGDVVIVVSDITRPIPYFEFLPELLKVLENHGIKRQEILILVATGMHRASTPEEHIKMFGNDVVKNYRIIDHDCENEMDLAELKLPSWSGNSIKLNRYYVEAGFRITTGLVEPHFMAGFSGGRKAICPGLISLNGVKNFHGYKFLSHPNAASTILNNNPCHMENSSVARLCPPDFSINIILDNEKKVNAIISGELFQSHAKAVEYVKKACCPFVTEPADVAITSSGGYPLDATFYQCVKGFVNCLPSVKPRGEIIAFGGCSEGVGSPEYTETMKKYSGNYRQFIEDIQDPAVFVKDQWQFQMHIRALEKVGEENLHFYSETISGDLLSKLSVNAHAVKSGELQFQLQEHIDLLIKEKKRIAVFPEGPYCSPSLNE